MVLGIHCLREEVRWVVVVGRSQLLQEEADSSVTVEEEMMLLLVKRWAQEMYRFGHTLTLKRCWSSQLDQHKVNIVLTRVMFLFWRREMPLLL